MQTFAANRRRRSAREISTADAESVAEPLNPLLTVTAKISLYREQAVFVKCGLGGPSTDDQWHIDHISGDGSSAQKWVGYNGVGLADFISELNHFFDRVSNDIFTEPGIERACVAQLNRVLRGQRRQIRWRWRWP